VRYVLGLEYNGTPYAGWQIQPSLSFDRTVQGVLESVLCKVMASPVRVICAGRTDAGVHATGQVIHFDAEVVRTPRALLLGANSLLPKNIVVRWVREAQADFHARFSALSRTYHYLICNTSVHSGIYAGRAAWCRFPLNITDMQIAANCLFGEHDFSAFRSSECESSTPVRRMLTISVRRTGAFVLVKVQANAFLHRMVRNIVGTLMQVGMGREKPEWVASVLKSRNRKLAGPTAAPDGLYLSHVAYPEQYGLPAPAGDEVLAILV
jgi:tRNA pseudouridine38-40 synthase